MITPFSYEHLTQLRYKTDEHADTFIDEIIRLQKVPDLNTVFKKLVYNSEIHSEKLPAYFEVYLNENANLPEWASKEQITIAQELFAEIGPAMVIAYFCKSLPECYACGKGAEVLASTGRLTEHIRRRIAKTAQFVLDVLSPGGLDEGGKAISDAVKVRLMHASIRYYFKKSVEEKKFDYDFSENGLPINQEDLLGTMLSFSFVVLEGAERLGFKTTLEEQNAVLHLWKCIGFLIGINEENMPKDIIEARVLWHKILKRNAERTNAGIDLNITLSEFLKELIPGKIFDGVIGVFYDTLLSKEIKDVLNIPSHKFSFSLAFFTEILAILLLKFETQGFFSKKLIHYINIKILYSLENYIAEGEDKGIYIPEGLRKNWSIDTPLISLFTSRSRK